MHRNRVNNCVAGATLFLLLMSASIDNITALSLPKGDSPNTVQPSSPSTSVPSSPPSATTTQASTTAKPTRAVDDNDTVMSFLHLTGSVIESADGFIHDMNETLKKTEYLLTKNGSQEYFSSLPDPWSIDDIAPKLVFFANKHKPLEIKYNTDPAKIAIMLQNEGLLDTNRMILITHGFHNNFNAPWLKAFRDDILNVSATMNYPQTVGLIGWGGGADLLVFRYRQAAANVATVGSWLGKIADAIHKLQIVKSAPQEIYGIGHSLGAHVMGIAGRQSKAFKRITGLDPAGPCFEKVDNSTTLYYDDADFVDVIHTDGYDSKLDPSEWIFPVNHYGSLVPIGTIDFYPNYGYHQPNAGAFTVAGSHLRALDLFQWSITNPGKFVTSATLSGVPDYDDPVEKWEPGKYQVEMGYYADRYQVPPGNLTNTSTLLYIKTNGQIPWV